MASRTRATKIKWKKRRTPMRAVAEVIEDAPVEFVDGYVDYIKDTAKGSLRGTGGRYVPVLSGALKRSIRRGNKPTERRPATIIMIGYARHLRQLPGALNRLLRRYGKSSEARAALRKTAKRANRVM